MIWSLLPKGKLSSFVYNEGVEAKLKSAKKLLSIAPNKDKIHEFNEKISKTLFSVFCLQILNRVWALRTKTQKINDIVSFYFNH